MKKTLEEFLDFLKKRMKPSHIYQPVMIKTLIDCGGSATVRQMRKLSCYKTKANSVLRGAR
jgi:hypothetical protein